MCWTCGPRMRPRCAPPSNRPRQVQRARPQRGALQPPRGVVRRGEWHVVGGRGGGLSRGPLHRRGRGPAARNGPAGRPRIDADSPDHSANTPPPLLTHATSRPRLPPNPSRARDHPRGPTGGADPAQPPWTTQPPAVAPPSFDVVKWRQTQAHRRWSGGRRITLLSRIRWLRHVAAWAFPQSGMPLRRRRTTAPRRTEREDDAFAQSWDYATAGPLWANPLSLLEVVVGKAEREGCLMLIIALEWPGRQNTFWAALRALCPKR